MSLIKYEGFDEAVVGITIVPKSNEPSLVYSFDRCVKLISEKENISEEEANEFVLYYMIDLETGDTNPIFITDYIEEVNLEFDFEKKPNLTLVS